MRHPCAYVAASLLALAIHVTPAAAQDIDPGFVINPSSFDFGEISAGERVQASFTFTNTGDTPLEIIDVKPSCGCTTADWTKDPIEPGQSGAIDASIDTTRLIGPQRQVIDVDVGAWNMRAILESYQLTVAGTVTAASTEQR